MAKKATPARDAGKSRFELRFDEDVYEGVKSLADKAGVSINQLMQGIARWAINCGHAGEAEFEDDGMGIASREQQGCLWFGQEGYVDEDTMGGSHMVRAEVYFSLDFTERHVIRDDWEPPKNPKARAKKGRLKF